jgi:hypothetical protein
MSITANSLRATSAKKVNFDVIVNDILKTIDADLARASSLWGSSSVVSQIPKSFVEARNVEHETARNIIYAAVISDLERRGFEVSIQLADDQRYATIRTSWEATMTQEKIDKMSSYVSERTIEAPTRSRQTKRTDGGTSNNKFLNAPI